MPIGPEDPSIRAARALEQRREATQRALAEVYSGASFSEADALLDQLRDLGFTVSPNKEQHP